jgi:hypothetical protein
MVERLFALLQDCRAIVPELEPGSACGESESAAAERLLYFGLASAIEAGLVRTAEDMLTVLRQTDRPLGPMGLARPSASRPERLSPRRPLIMDMISTGRPRVASKRRRTSRRPARPVGVIDLVR